MNTISSSANWDLKAEKGGKVFVIQVTCRIALGNYLGKRLAKILGMDYLICFVKPSLDRYLLTAKTDLRLSDLSHTKVGI